MTHCSSPVAAIQPVRWLALCAAVALSSCASYTTDRPEKLVDAPADWEPLPYHVAVVPFDSSKVEALPDGAQRSGAAFAFDFKPLGADSEEERGEFDLLTGRLQGVLETNAFRKVTVLPRPSVTEYEALSAAGLLPSYWVAAAREAEADLLLDVDSFSYPVKPKSRAELLSFALFLAGPVELLFPDREYYFDGVNLEASLYDIEGLDAPRYRDRQHLLGTVALARSDAADGSIASDALATASDFQFEPIQGGAIQGTLRQFIVSPPSMKFRFGDRLGGGPGKLSFWTSIFIPSAWLQRDSSAFAGRLTDDTAIALAQDLAREIVEGDYAYIVGPARSATGLLFDAKTARLTESPSMEGVLELKARIRRPATAFDRPQVRVMGRTYAIAFQTAPVSPNATFRNEIIRRAAEETVMGSMTSVTNAEGFDQEMTLYLPAPSEVGVYSASFAELSPLVPLDSVQLSLGEDLGSRGFREKSWTFDLASVYSEDQLEALQLDPVLGSSSTISAPVKGQ